MGLFYDYGPIYVNWEVDDYFDLTQEQKDWVEQKVRSHFTWHRNEELPLYIQFLSEVQTRGGDGLSIYEVQEGHQRIQVFWKRIIDHLLKDVVLFFSMLEPRQIDYLEQRFEEANAESQEYLTATREERKKERFEDLLDNLEDWLGDFSPSQEEQLQNLFNNWNQNQLHPDLVQKSRSIKRQKSFLSFLRRRLAYQKSRDWLEHWFRTWTAPKDYQGLERRELRVNRNIRRILQVDALLVPKQREHAVHQIDIWIHRLEAVLPIQ